MRTFCLRFFPVTILLALSACVTGVDYGKVRHSELSAGSRCNVEASDREALSGKDYFFATTRLPDCRGEHIDLTNKRTDRMRFGRYAPETSALNEKGKDIRIVPLAFEPEAAWWEALGKATGSNGRILLYVHGYKETFRTTSKDTVQMARLTEFDGPVVQYSWPSHGSVLSYAVDEANMYWDERNFRRFLNKMAQQPWVKEIVLVSHSMGARLVLPGVDFVDRNSSNADSSNISNIILASPDIDRQNFERDIAEEVLSARRVNNDRRITVYLSAKDQALDASRRIHGYPRLGNPYCFDPFAASELKEKGLPQRCYALESTYDAPPAKRGMTIIDTSALSNSGFGHSDFLHSPAVCADFKSVVKNGARGATDNRAKTHLDYVFTLQNMVEQVDEDICRDGDFKMPKR